ncbi:MAG TPA: helix-turn-helix domain-containing protein [Acidimicrobiales bacterium]|nr:helix-turn-helix domain-containing protein [Acidimicrobiales bacterium]
MECGGSPEVESGAKFIVLLWFLRLYAILGAVTRDDLITDDLISTGQASVLLGTSRQHVVDLCDGGRLACFRVGTHRRIRRGDVLRYRKGPVLTRDQVRSLWLHQAVARRLLLDPEGTVRRARRSLRRLKATHPRGVAAQRLEEWSQLLDGPIDELLEVMVSRSEPGTELRQNSPFAGVLTQRERGLVLDNFRRTHPAAA